MCIYIYVCKYMYVLYTYVYPYCGNSTSATIIQACGIHPYDGNLNQVAVIQKPYCLAYNVLVMVTSLKFPSNNLAWSAGEVKYVVNTHCHADHITSGGAIKKLHPEASMLAGDDHAPIWEFSKSGSLIKTPNSGALITRTPTRRTRKQPCLEKEPGASGR